MSHDAMAEDEFTEESGTIDRLNAFSDAVVSIAITLLALELPVPSSGSSGKFWDQVWGGRDDYLAFLISFVVIAVTWSVHHRVFRYAARSDSLLRALNFVWLFTIVLNPFATKLLTSVDNDTMAVHAARWGFYALLQVGANGAFIAMVRHMQRRRLHTPDMPADLPRAAIWNSVGGIVGFALSIPLFLVTRWAWIWWIVGARLTALVRRRAERAQRP